MCETHAISHSIENAYNFSGFRCNACNSVNNTWNFNRFQLKCMQFLSNTSHLCAFRQKYMQFHQIQVKKMQLRFKLRAILSEIHEISMDFNRNARNSVQFPSKYMQLRWISLKTLAISSQIHGSSLDFVQNTCSSVNKTWNFVACRQKCMQFRLFPFKYIQFRWGHQNSLEFAGNA